MPNPFVCGAPCASNAPGDIGQSENCDALLAGDINRLFLADTTVSFDEFVEPVTGSEINDPAAWSAVMDQAGGAGKVVTIFGKGSILEPEETTVVPLSGRERVTDRKQTVEYEVDNIDSATHRTFQEMQACASTYQVWLETDDGFLFGKSDAPEEGLLVTAKASFSKAAGEVGKWKLVLTYNDLVSPSFITSVVPSTP